jgi:hypothetical protein
MEPNLKVAEVFNAANLSPSGPVLRETDPPETNAGVYVVARVDDAKGGCNACALQFKDLLGIDLDLEYEQHRWLPNEPILYVGKQIDLFANVSVSSAVISAGIKGLMLAAKW